MCTNGACVDGHHDLNGSSFDGCEYACVPSGDEVCNGVDDDCNGTVDVGAEECVVFYRPRDTHRRIWLQAVPVQPLTVDLSIG